MKILLIITFFAFSNPLLAQSRNEKFDWGVGLLEIYGNHYRGSDQSKNWLFPMPYISYNSDKIEARSSFFRGIFYQNETFSLKLSFLLGLNAESKNNYARQGMPDLDYTFELGPMFIFHLWKSKNQDWIINFEVPIRESMATNFKRIQTVGLFAVPYLNIIHKATPASFNWYSEFSISPMYADKNYHQYYYGVKKEYELVNRPRFEVSGGYSGFQTALLLNKKFDHFAIIAFVRWDYLRHAVFENSPLVKVNNYGIAGLGLFWLFD